MTFGEALELVKQGELVTRNSWNGKGMFVFIRPQWIADVSQIENVQSLPRKVKEWIKHCYDGGDEIEFTPYLCMKTADGKVVNGWLASQTDMLSNDWEVVEVPF